MEKKNIEDIMDIPADYYTLSVPKLKISEAIKNGLKENDLTVRGLGRKINMKHPQIVRITSCENYNIDTLLKVLNGLNLEIVIKSKKGISQEGE